MIPNLSFNDAAELTRKIKGKRSSDNGFGEFVGYTILFTGIVAMFAGLLSYILWANAFVGSVLWGWFIAPVFGLPLITKAQAWGIAIMIAFWTHQQEPKNTDEETPLAERISRILLFLVGPWVALGVGWVAHHYFFIG